MAYAENGKIFKLLMYQGLPTGKCASVFHKTIKHQVPFGNGMSVLLRCILLRFNLGIRIRMNTCSVDDFTE
jgi:hypothetical protein